MSGRDLETDESLINPYVVIEGFDTRGNYLGSAKLNTHSFGINCQHEIMPPLTHQIPSIRRDLYKVWAETGEFDSPGIKNTVSEIREPRSRTFLGYLERDVVKENLPGTHDHFESRRKRVS